MDTIEKIELLDTTGGQISQQRLKIKCNDWWLLNIFILTLIIRHQEDNSLKDI